MTRQWAHEQWIQYAHSDIRTAEHLAKTMYPAPLETICFLCQQSAEKALKGFLLFHRQEPPRSHDLRLLCQMCCKFAEGFDEYASKCLRLNPYAVMVRYPNELQIEAEDVAIALKSAASILTFVESVIE